MNFKKTIIVLFTIFVSTLAINVNAKEGWVEENNEKYYYVDGEAVSGFKEIDGENYFFGITTKKLLHGWQYYNGKFYLDEEGKVKQGWNEIDGEKYYVKDNYMVNKWQEIDGENYFFGITTYKLLHGFQNYEGKFYLDNDGKANEGWNEVDGEKYYVKDKYLVNKWQEIDGENYFFGITTYKLLHGFQNYEGKFYLDSNGKVNEGWNEVDGEKYYVKDKYLVNNWQQIDGNNYFFGLTTYKLLHGFQNYNGKFYLDSDGKANEGWNEVNGEKYYVKNKYLVNKFQEIDGEKYFFGISTYKLLHGFQNYNGKFYADKETGIIKNNWFTVDNNEYYAKNNYLVTGINTIDDKTYYFEKNGKLVSKTKKTEYKEIKVNDETKEFIKLQYIPTYYNQKDSQWTNIKYGFRKFGPTGCAPTSMAMAFTSIKERRILPTDVADYLYYNTSQYNKVYAGTSGYGIIYAANNFGVKVAPINTKEDLIKELSSGKIVYAAMGNGKFGTKSWNHAIIMYNYDEKAKKTNAQDPLNRNNNGWVSIDTIWNEKSTDWDDLTGGSALYALSE